MAQQDIHPALMPAVVTAVEEVKGTPVVDPDTNEVVEGPTTAALKLYVEELVLTAIGQRFPRVVAGERWKMSNRAIFDRLDLLDKAREERGVLIEQMQAQIDAIPGQIEQAMQTVLQAATRMLEQTNQAQDTAVATQNAAFTEALAKQRQDLLAEILGSAAPLADMIAQIKAHETAEDSEHASIHAQLFNLLNDYSGKLTQMLTKQTTQDGLLTTTAANITSLQSSVAGLGTEQASMKLVDQGLRSDLTTQTGRIDGAIAADTALRKDLTTQTGRIDGVATTANAAKVTAEKTAADLATHTGNNLIHRIEQTKRVTLGAMLVGAAQTFSVTWDTPFADTNYCISEALVGGGLLSNLSIDTFTKTGCTGTYKNAGLVALAAGAVSIHLTATHD